jgi:hypothetical protein
MYVELELVRCVYCTNPPLAERGQLCRAPSAELIQGLALYVKVYLKQRSAAIRIFGQGKKKLRQ